MSWSVGRHFIEGLLAALVPPVLDYLIGFLGQEPVFQQYTPLIVALLIAMDKLVRERWSKRGAGT